MKLMLASLVLGVSALSAQAKTTTQTCHGIFATKGSVTLECDGTALTASKCSVTGTATNENNSPKVVKFDDCEGSRRAETNANMYKIASYFDVSDKACWSSYHRLWKKKFKNGKTRLSITKTSGGDTHDNSGYQYFDFECPN